MGEVQAASEGEEEGVEPQEEDGGVLVHADSVEDEVYAAGDARCMLGCPLWRRSLCMKQGALLREAVPYPGQFRRERGIVPQSGALCVRGM